MYVRSNKQKIEIMREISEIQRSAFQITRALGHDIKITKAEYETPEEYLDDHKRAV